MTIQKKQQPNKKEDASGKAGQGSGQPAGKAIGKPVTVHSYSGYKRDGTPRSFEIDGKKLTVLRVAKTWQEESASGHHRKTIFRVHAHDGKTYEIALDQGTGAWTLVPHRGRG